MKISNKNSTATVVVAASLIFGLMGPAIAFADSPPTTVNLGTAGNFAILAKAGISTTGLTAITGDIGVSPAAASTITGFALVADATNVFSKSNLVTGKAYAANYAVPTPATMTTAVKDMQTAYTDVAGRTKGTGATHLNVGAGTLSGLNFAPGTYTWGSNVNISGDITLTGNATDIWIFQISGTLNIASGKQVILAGGAQAKNIFWQVAGATTLGTNATFNGNILDQTGIAMQTGATLNGRALAQTAVTLDATTVTEPNTNNHFNNGYNNGYNNHFNNRYNNHYNNHFKKTMT